MSAKKTRKRAYIPPSSEVVNRRERTTSSNPRAQHPRAASARAQARAAYEYPQPGLRRTARRLPVYFVLIFALQYYLLGSGEKPLSGGERLTFAAIQAGVVTLVFAPFMHMMDKLAYNRWLKRTGKAPAAKSGN